MKKIYIAVVLLSGLLACKKEDVKVYHGGDRVQFARQNAALPYVGSQDFSFAAKGSPESATIAFPVDITGRVASFDRDIRVEIIASETTAAKGVDFDFGKSVVKAGESKGTIELLLKKTSALDKEVKTVTFRIVSSEHFAPGIEKQLKRKVSFFNFMVKPSTWDTRMRTYFGEYSEMKHKFILYHLGIPEINITPSGSSVQDPEKYVYNVTSFIQFQNKLRSLLNDLNSKAITPDPADPFTYPLVYDEDGDDVDDPIAVTFP
ncbi:DUF4843 domain-containing protein [Pedobacter nyackensis]|uniref:DUF4843 domain-containing protein n=1 Tax=Pedobacter nyackensis TaxID=475255 RepID=UPI00292D3BD2|nr:DUF4843 domain-containing protein [Pedobacter nyackensis]